MKSTVPSKDSNTLPQPDKVKCPYCPGMMMRWSNACRKCWRGGKGKRREPRGVSIQRALDAVHAMNLKPGESVVINGLTFTKTEKSA